MEVIDIGSGREGSLLEMEGLEGGYGGTQVLFGVDMSVGQGEIVALLGTNGAGKSTLLKAVSGLVDVYGGEVRCEGSRFNELSAVERVRRGIVQMPGGRSIFPTLSVAEHLRVAGWLYREDEQYIVERSEEALEAFPQLRERRGTPAGALSGGEQQMVGLAMALMARPKVLLVDELSLGLAPAIVGDLLEKVEEIRGEGVGVVLVEQSMNVALEISDRCYFLEKGRVQFAGEVAELAEREGIARSVFLGRASAGVGREEEREELSVRSPAEEVGALSIEGLEKSFGGVRAVCGVELDVESGEVLGIIGPNGAGKTTLFDLISGYERADAGQIWMKGLEITNLAPSSRAVVGLGRSFQKATLFPSMTVAENLSVALERHLEVKSYVADVLNLPGSVLQERDVAWSVDDLIELMNLGAFREKFVSELSTGSRRVVDLGMVMAQDPDVLLLDEPSSGLAQREAEALGPIVRRIHEESGCAVVVIEHDMNLIRSVADELVALDLGNVIARGSADSVLGDRRVVEAYLGDKAKTVERSGAGARKVEKKKRKGRRHKKSGVRG